MAIPTPPNRNTSRGYYSPNARIQEGYYQGNNRSVVIVIKTSIANAIYFVSKNRRIGVIKVAQSLISSLASATRSLNRVKKSSANAIGYIVPKRIDHFFRYSTARLANLTIAKKTYKGIRFAISNSINLAFNSKSTRRIKTSKATITAVIKSNKILSLTAKVIVTPLASTARSLNRVRKASANAIGYIVPKRIDHFFRYSTARLANLTIAKKTYKGIRFAISNSINLAFNSKSTRRIKTSKATITAVIKSNKILSLTAKVIVTPLAKTARIFGKSIKVVLAPSALFTRKRTQNKKAIAIQVVSATITRKKGPKRSAGVIVTYQIGTSKRNTMYRKAIANAVGLYKYSLKRIANIYTKESGTVQPVSQINYYVTPNNIDVAGNYAVGTDQPSDYAEPTNDPGVEYSIEKDQIADYTEPDFPNGEDVVPT